MACSPHASHKPSDACLEDKLFSSPILLTTPRHNTNTRSHCYQKARVHCSQKKVSTTRQPLHKYVVHNKSSSNSKLVHPLSSANMPLNYNGIKRSLSCTNLSSMTNDAHNYTHHRKDIENTSGNEEEQPLKKARTCKDHVVMVSPELTPATAAVLKLTSCLDDDHNNSNEYNCVSGDEDWYSYAQHVPVSPLTSQQQQAGKEVRFHLLGADTSTNGTVSRSISPIEELEAAYACDAVELPPLAFQPRISKSTISRQRKKKFMRRSRVQACRISDRFSPKGFMMPLSASSSLTDSSGSSGNGKEATIRRQCSSFSLNQLTADMARIMSN